MKEYKPVEIPNASFVFCKVTVPLLLWIALIAQSRPTLIVCFGILLLSALLKVRRAPLVFLYTRTIDRLFPSRTVIVDESAVRFAHTVGAAFSLAALLCLYAGLPLAGWIITGLLALLKTSGAAGFCGAMKLYGCLNNPNGTCCRAGKTVKKIRDRPRNEGAPHD